MKRKWHDIIFNVNYELDQAHFVMRCVNDKIEERLDIWKEIIYNSFGEKLPCTWKDWVEKKKLLFFADPDITPFVGFYEIINIEKNELPAVLTLVNFDPVNLSASVELLCINIEFSKRHPLLSGRLARQTIHKLDYIFDQLKPLYVILLVMEGNTGIISVVNKIGYQRQGLLPYYFLIHPNDKLRRKGTVVLDKFYGELE